MWDQELVKVFFFKLMSDLRDTSPMWTLYPPSFVQAWDLPPERPRTTKYAKLAQCHMLSAFYS